MQCTKHILQQKQKQQAKDRFRTTNLVLSIALVVNRHGTSLSSPYHLPANPPVPLLTSTKPIRSPLEYPWTSNVQLLVYTQKKERLHNANDRSNDGYGENNE
jgi:hypothetical protein